MNPRPWLRATVVLFGSALLVPFAATAQDSGAWRYSATVYAYVPTVSGKTAFPAEPGGTPINITTQQIIDNLKMTFMGSLEVHNGRWGAFTDVLYLDLGNTKASSRDFSIGNTGVPVGTSADLGLDLKGLVWTLAGAYRVAADDALTVDLLGGARLLDLKERLTWNIAGDIGLLPPASRSGGTEVRQTVWDGIVGVKGRYAFGDQRQWSLPFYLDAGAGQSQRTWQAAAGIGYGFKWGELSALYRYLDYDMKSDKAIQSVRFSGPMVGATFRW